MDIHGGSGIFHLHLLGSKFVTASKNSSVSYCSINSSNFSVVHEFDNAHSSVVKCARLNPNTEVPIIASVGNDRDVVILDARQRKEVQRIENVSPHALNNVMWRPGNERQLVTSGFEPNAIRLFDLRITKKCLSIMRGCDVAIILVNSIVLIQFIGYCNFSCLGHEVLTHRSSAINCPTFLGPTGDYIVTGGPKSKALHLYVCLYLSMSLVLSYLLHQTFYV